MYIYMMAIGVNWQLKSRLTANNLESRVHLGDAVWYFKYLVIYVCIPYASLFHSVMEVKRKRIKDGKKGRTFGRS